MSLKIQKINSANATVEHKILSKTLEEKMDRVANKIAKSVNLHGFRKGKAPLSIVKSRYEGQIRQDTQQEVVQDVLKQAINELGLTQKELIGNPSITKFEDNGKDIDLEIKIGIAPKIPLESLESCIPEVSLKEPTSKQIQEAIKDLAKSRAPLVEAKKGAKLEDSQSANIDFEGFIGDKAFDGGKAENFDLLIGSGQFIAGFEDQLIGMKAGENRDIKVTFPKDYQAKDLAGKEAVFKVKLNAIKIKSEANIDDEFAKNVLNDKESNLAKLEEIMKDQLKNQQKVELYNKDLKPKLANSIIEKIDFDLPDLIVEQEMNILFNNSLGTLSQKEMEELRNDPKKVDKKRESFRVDAQKSVKITFIIDAIAKERNIQIQDNEVLQTIYYESMMAGQDPKATIEHYKNNNLLSAIKMAMLEDKVLSILLDSKTKDATNATSKDSKPAKKAPAKSSAKPKKEESKDTKKPTAEKKPKTKSKE